MQTQNHKRAWMLLAAALLPFASFYLTASMFDHSVADGTRASTGSVVMLVGIVLVTGGTGLLHFGSSVSKRSRGVQIAISSVAAIVVGAIYSFVVFVSFLNHYGS